MSEAIEEVRDELATVALAIARLLTHERYDEAELAHLDVRQAELREKIRQAEAPARRAREDAACIHPW